MPWSVSDVEKHTKKATTPKLKRMWIDIANAQLKSSGDEARAIRIASGVVKKHSEDLLCAPAFDLLSEALGRADFLHQPDITDTNVVKGDPIKRAKKKKTDRISTPVDKSE